MPRRPVSQGIKDCIPVLYHKQGYDVASICNILGIRKSLVYQTLKYHRDFSTSYNTRSRGHPGRRRVLDNSDICYIKALLAQEHCIYLDEIQDRLLTERGVWASIPTLVRTLQHLSHTHKCVSIRALE